MAQANVDVESRLLDEFVDDASEGREERIRIGTLDRLQSANELARRIACEMAVPPCNLPVFEKVLAEAIPQI